MAAAAERAKLEARGVKLQDHHAAGAAADHSGHAHAQKQQQQQKNKPMDGYIDKETPHAHIRVVSK